MDRLERMIREAAERRFPDVPLAPSGRTLDDIPDEMMAAWARSVLRALADIPNISFKTEPDPIAEAMRQATLYDLFKSSVLTAPTVGEADEVVSRLFSEAVSLAVHLRIGIERKELPQFGLKRPGASYRDTNTTKWGGIQATSVTSATLMEMGGLSRRQACRKVAAILARHGVDVAGETIRRTWFGLWDDWSCLHPTEFGDSLPPLAIDIWIGELPGLAWGSEGSKDLEAFTEYVLSKRNDLLNRYIPKELAEACEDWKAELMKMGDNGV